MAFKSFSFSVPSGVFASTSAVGTSATGHGSATGSGTVSTSGSAIATGTGAHVTVTSTGHDGTVTSTSHSGDPALDHATFSISHTSDYFHF